MTEQTRQLLDRALDLSAEQRAELANALLLSLEDPPLEDQQTVDAAWRAEIVRRADEVLSGTADTVDAEEMLRDVREELRQKYGI